ncbi:MAG: MBL fold metallo-hydrolase, partial [Dehalococcoidia bacterium]
MMKLEEVATGVYACLQQGEGTTLGWSNSGFIDHGGGLVVDTFWDKRLTARLLELYADVNPRSPRTLINTHHNVDHTGGNGLLAGAKIIAHRDCPPAIERETAAAEMFKALVAADSSKLSPAQADLANELRPFDLDAVEPRLPDTLVDDRMLLDLDGLPVEIEHLGPAHTDNDLIVHLPEQRVVFTGDLLFWRCAPIGWSGTTAAWVEALDTIEALDPEVVVPGHGPV